MEVPRQVAGHPGHPGGGREEVPRKTTVTLVPSLSLAMYLGKYHYITDLITSGHPGGLERVPG